MTKLRQRTETIREFIIQKIASHPSDIAKVAGAHFHITRQAVNKHLQVLVNEGVLTPEKKIRTLSYKLCAMVETFKSYDLTQSPTESDIWTSDIKPSLGNMPENVMRIWQYGFTEMFNNVIDHSGGTHVTVRLIKTAAHTELEIHDDGIGIFKKIQMALNLLDERHAVLELAKGKFTTDPLRHSGEGIFFSSKMFDDFNILSGGVYFSHQFGDEKNWILEREAFKSGTSVWMELNNHTARTTTKILNEFSGVDFAFDKTVVPVRLAQYGDDALISRSQAKRLLARIDRFKVVMFDFKGVDAIGQAFADEVFRIFVREHPTIEISAFNTNAKVADMISRARAATSNL